MRAKIYDIAMVQTGVFVKKSPTPNAVYLQQSDFDEEGNVDVSLCPTIEVSDKYMLNSGDFLVVCKGGKNQCKCEKFFHFFFLSRPSGSCIIMLFSVISIMPDDANSSSAR